MGLPKLRTSQTTFRLKFFSETFPDTFFSYSIPVSFLLRIQIIKDSHNGKRESLHNIDFRSNWNILLAFNSNLNHVEFTHTPLTVSREKEEFSWLQPEHQGIAWLFCTAGTKCSDQHQTRSIYFAREDCHSQTGVTGNIQRAMAWYKRQNVTPNLIFHQY